MARTPLFARAALSLLAVLAAPSARAQVACTTDSECPWSSCQAGLCAQPPGLSHVAEVQLDPATVLTPLVNSAAIRLRDGNNGLCSVSELDCDLVAPAYPGEKCTLTRVTFPGPISLRWSATTDVFDDGTNRFRFRPVQAVVPLEAHVVRSRCLNDPSLGCGFNQPDNVLPLEAVFRLTSQSSGGVVSLCEHLDQVILNPIDVLPLLGLQVADQCVALDQLTALSGDIRVALLDARVSASEDLSRLAVRLWFQSPASEPDTVGPAKETFQAFLRGQLAPAPTTTSTDWSIFLGEQLMNRLAEQNVVPMIQTEVANAEVGVQVNLDQAAIPPDGWTSTWTPAPVPTTALTIALRTQDLAGNVVLVSLNANASFALDTTAKTLTIAGTFGYSAFLSGWAAAVFPPAQLLLQGFVLSGAPTASLLETNGLCTVDGKAATFSCTLPSELPAVRTFLDGPSVRVAITALEGDPAGLLVGGTASYVGVAVDLPVTAQASDFRYGWDDCSSQMIGYYGTLDLGGTGRVCSVQKIGDPYGEYAVTDPNPIAPELPKHYRLQSYWGASSTAPLNLTVRTTNGSGRISLPAPKAASWSEQLETFFRMARSCTKLETGWLGIPGKFDPHWNVDPPFDPGAILIDRGIKQQVSVHLRDVRFTAGDRLEPKEGEGGIILESLPLKLEATLFVDRGEKGSFAVPVSTELVTTLVGADVDAEARLFTFRLLEPAWLKLEVLKDALPEGAEDLSAVIVIAPEDVELSGFL